MKWYMVVMACAVTINLVVTIWRERQLNVLRRQKREQLDVASAVYGRDGSELR